MAEVFGTQGETITVDGEYECSECGFRQHFAEGGTFPEDHHAEKPWTLYVADQAETAS